MKLRYDLVGTETHEVPLSNTRNEHYDFFRLQYDVYHFRPKPSGITAEQRTRTGRSALRR